MRCCYLRHAFGALNVPGMCTATAAIEGGGGLLFLYVDNQMLSQLKHRGSQHACAVSMAPCLDARLRSMAAIFAPRAARVAKQTLNAIYYLDMVENVDGARCQLILPCTRRSLFVR